MFSFRGSEISTEFDRARVNVRHARRLAGETHVWHLFVAVPGPRCSTRGGTNHFARRASHRYRAYFFHLDLLVLQRFDDDVEVGHRKRRSRNLKNIRAQVGDFLFHVDVRALHDGHHRDQCGYAHRQSQHGERGAQLVRAQGAEAQR